MAENETLFTPGPWLPYIGRIDMDGGLNPFFRGTVALLKHSGEGNDVAVILDRNDDAHDYEANAHLIATAPKLYRALSNVLASIAEDLPSLDLVEMEGPAAFNLAVCLGLAYEALAEARGEPAQ